MRNSKKTQLLIVTVVGIILFSFIPMVQGSGTTKRSLDDWFYAAYGGPLNPHVDFWASDTLSDPVIMFPHFDGDWNLVPVWECDDYTGFVLDREMSDGRHMITVHMRVKGVPVVVETFEPENPTIFVGEMDYIYVQKFIVNITEWSFWLVLLDIHDTGFDDNGNILLPRGDIPMVFGSMFGFEFVSILFIGSGKGTAVNYWNRLEPGDSAKVKVGQFGVANEDFVDWKIDYIKVY